MSETSDELHERIRTGNHETATQRSAERRRRIGTVIFWIMIVILVVPWFFPRYYWISVPLGILIWFAIAIRYWITFGVH